MLKTTLDKTTGIATLTPDSKLSESDFQNAANTIDPYIETEGHLRGLIISTRDFPGWESFSAFVRHLSFVRDHHKKSTRTAIVTDSAVCDLAQSIGKHFVAATVAAFAYNKEQEARDWIMSES